MQLPLLVNPQRFFRMLETMGIKASPTRVSGSSFIHPERFCFNPERLSIIMTEKDAVKCRSLGLENAWYLPVDTHLPS